MQKKVIEKLIALNNTFYDNVEQYFDNSRNYNWEGWKSIIKYIKGKDKNSIDILDIGCGNGRFAGFVKDNIETEFEYLGVDNNLYLLKRAEDKYNNKNIKFIKSDILLNLLEDKDLKFLDGYKFDLIVLFGVLHHIPSENLRNILFENLKKALKQNGKIIISCWNFLENKRISNKVIDWNVLRINEMDVDEGDCLLTWDRGTEGVRYCHYYTEQEMDIYFNNNGLKVIEKFKADGKGNNLNTYFVITQ